MEMADAIVINKADGDNIDKANLAATHFRNALHLFPPTESGWRPKVLTYSGFYGLGIKEIWDMVDEYRHFATDSGYFEEKRQRQTKWWMYESINEALKNSFYQSEAIRSSLMLSTPCIFEDLPYICRAKRMIFIQLKYFINYDESRSGERYRQEHGSR